jgi:hypothetical protein
MGTAYIEADVVSFHGELLKRNSNASEIQFAALLLHTGDENCKTQATMINNF